MVLLEELKRNECFTKTEQQIAQFIIENTREVVNMNIEYFSSLNYVSNSTVVRFCQKIGFKGFSDFRIKLATELNDFLIDDKRIEESIPFSSEATTEEVSKTLLNLYYQSITDTYDSFDLKKIEEAANCLRNSSLISLWGQGPSQVMALDFYYNLKRFGYVATCDAIQGYYHVPMKRKTTNEVAVIFSNYGNSSLVKQWVSEFRLRNTQIILICDNIHSPLLEVVDYPLVADTTEKRVYKVSHYSSRVSMNLVTDLLYSILFNLDYDDNLKILKKANSSIDDYGEVKDTLLN